MANPFERFKKTSVENPGEVTNPFEKFRKAPTDTEVLSGQDPLFDGDTGLNTLREEGELDAVPSGTSPEDDYILSQSELYDQVRQKPEFRRLSEHEDQHPFTLGADLFMPDDLRPLKELRDKELQEIYQKTGREESFLGIPYRVQEEMVSNPDFDGSRPPGPDNPADISKEYFVDPPTREPLIRAGYQVLENIVGGLADLTEGKISQEGTVGKALPETVPDSEGEKIATELTTFIVGPLAAEKTLMKGVPMVARGAGGTAEVMAKAISPEAQQAVRTVYQETLRRTGSAAKAWKASTSKTKAIMVGTALGLTEAAVAPDDSEGFVASPEYIQKKLNLSPERARDVSLMLDAPVISGVLGTVGTVYQMARDKVINPAVGGLRNVTIAKVNPGGMIPLTKKQAGLHTLMWLDPNLGNLAPEDAVFKMKVLGDTLERNATKELKIGNAGRKVNIDTPAAFADGAKDYYRVAYADLRDSMGQKEFNDWVNQQATSTANRLFELRTSLVGSPEVGTPMASTSNEIRQLFEEGANDVAGGSFSDALAGTSDILADAQRMKQAAPDFIEQTAKDKADLSKEAYENAIVNDPEIGPLIKEAQDEYDLGSNAKLQKKLKDTLSEPLYQSYKRVKEETDEAYQHIANLGADGDPVSILEIIQRGSAGEEPTGVLKKIADKVNKDSSFGNIYNSVRKDVSDALRNITESGKDPEGIKTTLMQLSENIRTTQLDELAKNGDKDVVQAVENARASFQKLQGSWYDQEDLQRLSQRYGKDRLRKENFPEVAPGMPQGKQNWDINVIRTVQSGLEGADAEGFRDAIQRAARVGYEDVSQGLSEYYAAKSIKNLADRMASGDKQSVRSVRSALKGVVEHMEGYDSPLIQKFKDLEVKIQTLENTANTDLKAYEVAKEAAGELRKEANASVLKRFLGKEGDALGPGNTNRTLQTIFNAKDSVPRISELLRKADELGPDGEVVREALRGSYVDYLKNKIYSRQPIAIGDVVDGVPQDAFKANSANISKIFDPNSPDLDNIKLIFKDHPEMVDNLKQITDTLSTATKTTPKAAGDVFGKLPTEEDPASAINSLITLTWGPLSRTGTRARRLTAPIGVKSREQVLKAQGETLLMFINDPEGAAALIESVKKGVSANESRKTIAAMLTRAGIRTAMTREDEMPPEVRKTK